MACPSYSPMLAVSRLPEATLPIVLLVGLALGLAWFSATLGGIYAVRSATRSRGRRHLMMLRWATGTSLAVASGVLLHSLLTTAAGHALGHPDAMLGWSRSSVVDLVRGVWLGSLTLFILSLLSHRESVRAERTAATFDEPEDMKQSPDNGSPSRGWGGVIASLASAASLLALVAMGTSRVPTRLPQIELTDRIEPFWEFAYHVDDMGRDDAEPIVVLTKRSRQRVDVTARLARDSGKTRLRVIRHDPEPVADTHPDAVLLYGQLSEGSEIEEKLTLVSKRLDDESDESSPAHARSDRHSKRSGKPRPNRRDTFGTETVLTARYASPGEAIENAVAIMKDRIHRKTSDEALAVALDDASDVLLVECSLIELDSHDPVVMYRLGLAYNPERLRTVVDDLHGAASLPSRALMIAGILAGLTVACGFASLRSQGQQPDLF